LLNKQKQRRVRYGTITIRRQRRGVQIPRTCQTGPKYRFLRDTPYTRTLSTNRFKRPDPKTRPRWVCIVSHNEAQRLGDVSELYRCRNSSHPHYSASKVDAMVARNELVWVGRFSKIAQYPDHMTWSKAESGGFAVMEMVRGNSSKRGASQHCQNMPSLSGFRGGGPVAYQNDGRLE
jgi:hypothetical protein